MSGLQNFENLAAVREPVMCANCAEMIKKCLEFVATCFNTHDCMVQFVNNKDTVKLDLVDVHVNQNENGAGIIEDQDICRLCMKPLKDRHAIFFNAEEGDVPLKKMLELCLPELDLSIFKKSVICPRCYESLEMCFRFVTDCLVVEEKIKKYCEILGVNDKCQIELSSLLQFTMTDVTVNEVDGNLVDIIKVEKQFCEEDENAYAREVRNTGDVLTQIVCEDSENVKGEVEHEIENLVDMDNMKFNKEEQFTPKDALNFKEESNNFDVIKTEETICGENLGETENKKCILNEEVEIKMDEPESNRFENGGILRQPDLITGLHKRWKHSMSNLEEVESKPYLKLILNNDDVSKITMYQCQCCSFKTKYERSLKIHYRLHKIPTETQVYQYEPSSSLTNNKNDLQTHSLAHKDPLEVAMYKCESCPYQTKYRKGLNSHLLVHKDPSQVTMYKCNSCPYQTKYRKGLNSHFLVHKDPSQVMMHKCDSCSFQTKHRASLRKHTLIHKDLSEVTMYKCEFCLFQTVCQRYLKKHLLVHKDPSEVTMYKCDSCSYQTKYRKDLITHLLSHKDPSELIMHQCDSCSHQTKNKYELKQHSLVHKNPAEVTMFQCDSCSYKTKYKCDLRRHLLVHKDPSVVTYKCEPCLYQTNRKDSLKRHMLSHKSPSEVTMYNCSSCSYQTRYINYFKTHLRIHKDPSEVMVHQCGLCSFRTKRKYNLKMHLLVHNKRRSDNVQV